MYGSDRTPTCRMGGLSTTPFRARSYTARLQWRAIWRRSHISLLRRLRRFPFPHLKWRPNPQ
ncbi:hypothetical protein ACFPRL_09960 [Pseudoclavibacter helvolus]